MFIFIIADFQAVRKAEMFIVVCQACKNIRPIISISEIIYHGYIPKFNQQISMDVSRR